MDISAIKYTDDGQTLIRITTTGGEVVIVPWPSTDWYSRFVQEWIGDGNTIAETNTFAVKLRLAKNAKRDEIKAEGLSRIQAVLPFISSEKEVEAWKTIVAGSLQSLPSEWKLAARIYQTTKDSIITLNGLSNLTVINNIDVVNDIDWPAGSPALVG